MTETIKVSESLELHAVAESHVTPLYQLICKNKTWLQPVSYTHLTLPTKA